MRLAVLLVLLSLSLTACGHSDYDGFMNGSVRDVLGVLAFPVMVFSGVAYLVVNRRNGERAKGAPLIGEAALIGVFFVSMGAASAYMKDPAGWLTITEPTTTAMFR